MNPQIIVDKLKNAHRMDNVTNQYSQLEWGFSNIACHNLSLYFKHMQHLNPHDLLVGEAPGYNGCKLTGVPFTSEKIIADDNIPIFGLSRGYWVHDFAHIQTEQTSTITWDSFKSIGYYPLLWNSFPFHPNKPLSRESNRQPTVQEIEFGKNVIIDILACYNIKHIYAIGKTAQKSLAGIGINAEVIRHPANGGKQEFCRNILRIRSIR